jgi:tRNA (guanine37-N1)-methyltransferase
MKIDIITLFPELFEPFFNTSLLGSASSIGRDGSPALIDVDLHNLRDHGIGVHKSLDDTLYGGGAGMLMRADVLGEAIDGVIGGSSVDADFSAGSSDVLDETVLIFPTPSGIKFTQEMAAELSGVSHLVFCATRFEGYDARVPEYYRGAQAAKGVRVLEVSIGDYVLNGGEVGVMAMVEAITRLIPGFMGKIESTENESFSGVSADNLRLEERQYTRPETWHGLTVPSVLLGGNHAKIAEWRKADSEARTAQNRPDLI